MTRILLDTNAHSNFLKGDQRVRNAIYRSDKVLFSTVVIAELLYGFKLGNRE